MVDFWQKKGFICYAQHPNIASYRLCAWPSFPGGKTSGASRFYSPPSSAKDEILAL